MATKKSKGLPHGKRKAVSSVKDLKRGKRPTELQVEKAKKAKAIKVKHRVIGRERGRTEVSLGTHKKENVAGVVKGFRQKTKGEMGVILKDSDGNVIARTHLAKGHTTIPEQLVVRALAKYGKVYDEVTVVLTVRSKQKKRKKK